jgi:hypothetical protein
MVFRARMWIVVLVMAWSACSNGGTSDNGSTSSGQPAGGLLGAACAANADCTSGLVCQTALRGGYCTKACFADAECEGGVCVAGYPTSNTCLRTCNAVGQCREAEGYACNLVRDATLACVPGAAGSSSGGGSSGAGTSVGGSSVGGSSGSTVVSSGTASSTMAGTSQPGSSNAGSSTMASSAATSGSSAGVGNSSAGGTSSVLMSSSAAGPSSSTGAASSSSSGAPLDRTAACNGAQTLTLGTLHSGNTLTNGTSVVEGCQRVGVLGRGTPENVWILTLAEAGGLTLRVNSAWDAGVYMLGGPGTTCLNAPVLREDACEDRHVGGVEEVITVNWLEAGTYWVVVDAFASANPNGGSYTLRADFIAGGTCAADPSITPPGTNNTANNTASLLFPPDVESVCGVDEDWYAFDMSGGDATVSMAIFSARQGSLLVDFYTLTGTAPNVAAAPYTTGITAQGNVYTLTSPPTGRYGVRVRGTGLGASGITYRPSLTRTCNPDLYEPDDAETGTKFFMNSTGALASRLQQTACAGNVDRVLVAAPSTGPATITLSGGAGLVVTVEGLTFLNTGNDVLVPNPAGVTIGTSGADKVIQWNAVVGRALRLTVALPGGTTTEIPYTLRTQFQPVGHDECAGATLLTLPPVGESILVPFTTVGRNNSVSTDDALCLLLGASIAGPDVFFTFTTGGVNPVLEFSVLVPNVTTVPAGVDHSLIMLTGGCGGTESGCETGTFTTVPLPQGAYTLVADSNASGYEVLLQVARTQ